LQSGKSLGPGASVRTSAGSQVDLFLDENGPTVVLFENTTLGLDRLEINRTGVDTVIETQLNLREGTIRGEVNRLSAASKYEVKTPNVVAGVRANTGPTRYQISANGVLHVIDGSMTAVYVNPVSKQMSTHTVNSGQTLEPPVNPGAPGATPTVRPTRADEVLPVEIVPPAPKLVLVPQPEPYVSPLVPPRKNRRD